MDPDEDPFVASRVSLQSRRERLAKRNEQNTQETQRFSPSDDNHNAEASLLPDAYSTAPDGGCPSTGRVRRPSETRQSTNSSTGRDREYVQPKIVDHCDVVALSLIQSSSILSMEEQTSSSSHTRCGRSLSGEGSMSPLRRTMPAKMRASFSGERGLLDNSSIADPSAARLLRRTSVDCTSSVPAANGGAGESSSRSSVANGKLRRQSSVGNEAAGAAATGPFGWMPGNSTLTSGPAQAAEADESGYSDAKRTLESTPSEGESREERIARYKEQRRRSKQAQSFMCGTNDEREISGSATKQWHSLEDEQQQQQQPLRRGSGVFFDPRRPSSSDAVRSMSISSSFSDSTASDLSSVGVSTRRRDSVPHSADGSSAASPPLHKPELTQRGVPSDAPERAAADAAEIVTPQAALSPLSPSSTSLRHSQPAGISDAQVSDPNCVASSSTTNPRRNSARRRRSNLLADAEQADAAPVLLEVPAEAESGDAGADSVSVVTRPRRRRTTAEKSECAESGGAREITRDSGNQALWQQWQQLTSPRGAASPLLTEAAVPAAAATTSSPVSSTGKPSGTTVAASSAERGSAENPGPHGVRSEKADRRRAAGSGDAPELPSDDAVQAAKLSATRSASATTARRVEEDEPRSGSSAAEAQPATSVASTSTPASLLGSSDLPLTATVVESAASATCDNQAVEAETKANPIGCSLPAATTAAVPHGTDTSGVGSATAPPEQNKKRSEKKNAALGLILQKFEAANNVLPPALAAAIGLPSPTSSSADSSQPKPTPLVKTGKVESTIKQMASGQQATEPSSAPHATEKAATHAAHPAASVGSLVRKFAGAASPPTSLHLSLLSSTDGSDAATIASKSSASPVRLASPAAGIAGDAAGGSRQPQQRAEGGGSSSSRPPSPKVGSWPPVGTGVRSGHSSPGSARRSPVSAASPAAFAQASNVTDSDASSQLTDDGQHSDVASGRRHASVPAMKQHLQSPEKLQSQQLPYFSAIGKKSPKAGSTPVAPSVTSAEAADEPARADGRLPLAAGRHEEDFGVQCNANTDVSSLEPAETEVSTDADGRQLLPREGAKRMQTEAINSVHEASSAGLASPADELAAAAALAVAADEVPADAQHRSLTGDLRSSSACQQQQQPQTFAKLRAAPPPPPSKPSASAKSEPSQPLLDPQLATILQARLKKVESKGLAAAAAAAARPSSSSAGSQVHDEQQHGKSAGRDDAVDRSAHSIKDRAQYFMQMQQRAALGAADASPTVGHRPAGQGVVSRQSSTSTEHARNDSALDVHSRPAATHHTDAGRQEPSTDLRPAQSGDPAADSTVAAADNAVQQAERSQQKSSKKERRRDRRRRGSFHGGKGCDRWQTQPVTDSEVLVAAAVVVRGQPGSVVLTADGLVQPDGSGLQASAAAGFAGVAGAITAQPSGVGDDVDEVRRLAVMTLEEKIGLFMDRSVAWSNCTDAEAAAVSPDRSIRRLPKGGEVATSRRYRRCAWLGRFSTQPVSPAEVHRALRVLGSSALTPPAELSAELNAKIERLCLQLAEHQHADKQSAGAVVNQRQDKAGRSVVRRSAGGGKKASGTADPNVSLHLNGSNESHAQHTRTKTETGRRAVPGTQRKGAARPTSLIADPHPSSLLHAEQNGGSPEVYRTDSEGISRGSTLRQSHRAPAPAMRSKTSEKPAKARPVSMNFDLSVHADSAATHGAASPETDPARGAASVKSAVSRQRPHSAKAAVTTQSRVRKDDATKSNGAAAGPSSASDARRASTNKSDEKKEKISHPENAPRSGAERNGVAHEVPPATEQLTWADKSKSQPCISTMEDDVADDDLPSYMRATSSYARKVEHLLMESDDEEESSNARLAPDSDRSSLDASHHDSGSRATFQRAVAATADGATTRASVRRALGSRISVGAPLESPTSGHSSDVPSYMRATKAVSMRDIRSPAGKPSPSAEEPTSTAVGVRTKRRSVDGSRNSLPPPQRPASVTTGDQSASGESDGGDDDDDDELPSYMRATKSFARKVEHLIESCDEDDEDAVATTRRDECSDAGDRASSARRSPAPRRSRTPSTHGGSDLTPSEPYAPPTRDSSKQLDSDGGNDRSQKRKPQRSATSRNASSTSLHADGPAAHQEYVPELSSPGAVHGPSSGRTAEAVAPIVDGRKRKAKTSETLTQSAVLAEVNGNHKAEAVAAHGKSQHQGKDKHALLGGDLPSFMRATKSSSTKDRHRPGSMTLPEHATSDVVKSTKALAESIGKQHVKGQGSRESLCSTGANSSRAESGHHSSSESAEHAHVAPIPLVPVSNFHATTTTSKSRKSSSSRTSATMGVVPRHTKQPIGAAAGAVG